MNQPNELPEGFFNVTEKRAKFVKAGFVGASGSGKSYTSLLLAMGLYDHVIKNNPNAILYYFDTENSMDNYIPQLNERKISWMAKTNSRNLDDLNRLMIHLDKNENHHILIVDSLSHIHTNLRETYQKKYKKPYLNIKDIMHLKGIWSDKFSELAVFGNFHLIICGREGDKFEMIDTGEKKKDGTAKKELIATDKKMRGDAETAYEFGIYCRMEKIFQEGAKSVHDGKIQRDTIKQLCTVLTDKTRIMHGSCIVNPTYDNFAKHVEFVTSGEGGKIEALQKNNGEEFDQSPEERKEARAIAEEIHNTISTKFPGSTADTKAKKIDLAKYIYGTSSKIAINEMSLDQQLLAKEKLDKYFAALDDPDGADPDIFS